MSYTHLRQQERYAIGEYRRQRWSIRRIAEELDRSPSTISRELRRNGEKPGFYDGERAEQEAASRQSRRSSRPWKLTERMRREIERRLYSGESPDIIAGRSTRAGEAMISHEWIYQMIYRDRADGGRLWQCLASKRKRRKKRSRGADTRGQLVNRVMITERPAEVDTRVRRGDWEGDSIVGRGTQSRLVSMVERQSRYLRLVRPRDRSADATADAIITALHSEVITTLTVDNGKEFARHERIATTLTATVYFAEPYSSWQRGSNEHLNGMIRRYFPKGTDFSTLSDAEIEVVQNRLNNRPRKLLGYATPWEVYSGRAHPPPVAL